MLSLLITLNLIATPQVDKAAHFGLSFAGTAVCAKIAQKIAPDVDEWKVGLPCLITVNAIGVAKEIKDSTEPGNKFDEKDVLANGLGSLGGYIMISW